MRALFLVVLGLASAAWPCRGPFYSLEENVASADVVAVVTFVSQKVVGKNAALPQSDDVELTFTVEETLKGKPTKTLVVRSDTTTCGYSRGLEPGRRVLLFARGTPLATSAVSGNVWLEGPEAAKTIAAARAAVTKAR
jgi:hypothetical protein